MLPVFFFFGDNMLPVINKGRRGKIHGLESRKVGIMWRMVFKLLEELEWSGGNITEWDFFC